MASVTSQGEGKENADAGESTRTPEETGTTSIFAGASLDDSTLQSPRDPTLPLPFSKRAIKQAPSPRQDELREKRRGQFLKKVREGRDDRRFEVRGEDVLRAEYLRQRRKWEGEMAFQAPMDEDEEETDGSKDVTGWDDLPMSSAQSGMLMSAPGTQRNLVDDDQVEEVAGWEDGELDALLEFMPGYSETNTTGPEDTRTQNVAQEHFGSDDEDFEALFSELMEQDAMSQEQPPQQDVPEGQVPPVTSQGEAMDMS